MGYASWRERERGEREREREGVKQKEREREREEPKRERERKVIHLRPLPFPPICHKHPKDTNFQRQYYTTV